MARTVSAPDGSAWSVRRQWVSHRARWRGATEGVDALDALHLLDMVDEPTGLLTGVLLLVAVVAIIAFAAVFLFPVLILLVEIAIVALLVAGGIVAKVLFRRPWTVTAAKGGRVERTWKRVGWRESGRLLDDVATAIQRGQPMPF